MNDNTIQKIQMVGAAGIGFSSYALSRTYGQTVLGKFINNKFSNTPTSQDIAAYRLASADALKQEGFDTYGVQIKDCSTPEGEALLKLKEQNLEKQLNDKIKNSKNSISKCMRTIQKRLKLKRISTYHNAVRNGKNAFATSGKNKFVLSNMEKFPYAVFHELGHHYNHKSLSVPLENILYKVLRNQKVIKRSLLGIFLVSMFTNKKPKNEQNPLNPFYPVGKFIKDNCGKLSFLLCMPLLAEETMASINGQRIGKKYLPKEHLKSLSKMHFSSFLSYAGYAVLSGLSMYLANLARDSYMDYVPKLRGIVKNYRLKQKSQPEINYNSVNQISMNEFMIKSRKDILMS